MSKTKTELVALEPTKLSAAIKSIAASKGMLISEVADKAGMNQNNLNQILARDTMSMKTLKRVMGAMGEEITILLSNGNKFKIE